jgi:hypothetical protein
MFLRLNKIVLATAATVAMIAAMAGPASARTLASRMPQFRRMAARGRLRHLDSGQYRAARRSRQLATACSPGPHGAWRDRS